MIWQIGPCGPTSNWVIALNAVLNTVQAVLLGYLAQRAVRKNREEAEKRRDNEP